jgi:hypothetical protein
MSTTLYAKKTSAEILAAAFTDHNAVVLKLQGNQTPAQCGRSYWKLNVTLLQKEGLKEKFKQKWDNWKMKQNKYINVKQWWKGYVKQEINGCSRNAG